MSKKIYIHLEDVEGYPCQTSKIQVPKSWSEKEVTDVIKLFADAYNKKNPDNQLDIHQVHFINSDGQKIFSNDKVSEVLEDLGDYHIKLGRHIREQRQEVIDKDALRCRNYGCNQFYKEDDNEEGACCHHAGPPVFHDTAKYWSCCPDRKAYDFESFQQITGCTRSRHCHVVKEVVISASPNAVTPSTDNGTTPPVLKSISAFNQANPSAVSAASAAAKMTERKSTRQADGTARCQRKGCSKTFVVTENNDQACRYHAGQPIFHDAVKFWSCCSDKKCYDFDEFLAVPGCAVGFHDDGVIEL
eukprot:gene9173-10126_t